MNSWVIQSAAVTGVALLLGRTLLAVHRRRKQSWERLLKRLLPAWPEFTLSVPAVETAAHEKERMKRLVRVWTACRNAQTLQEFADYALRNFESAERVMLAKLHADATFLRFLALAVLLRYALKPHSHTRP